MPNSFVLTGVLQIQAPRNLQPIIASINRQLAGITANINLRINPSSINNLNNLGRTLTRTQRQVTQFTDDIERAGYQTARTLRRYGAFTFATGAFIQFGRAISSGVRDAIEFERAITKVRQVTGTSLRDLRGLSDEITRLSTTLGSSSKNLVQASLTLSQAGLSADKVKKSLQALAKTELSATFDDIVDTTEGAIAIFQQFGAQAEDLEGILSSINTVSAKFAVESSDIITAVRRTGGAFQAAGGTLNELNALFTSVRQTTRESAESIATGFRTIFTRLQRVRTQDFLKTLGIDLRDMENQFIGPFEAVRKLSRALEQVPSTDPRFAQVIEELGGFRQVSKVIPLIQKFGIAQQALNLAQRSSASLSEEAAIAQESLANKIARVTEQFEALIRKITETKSFKTFVDIALSLATAFTKVAESIIPLLPLISGIAALKIGSGLVSYGAGFKKGLLNFNSGGMVPGVGNRDTVPAMLTPGEFVIRKDAVKAIGANKLAKVNGFASGGSATDKDSLISQFVSRGLSEKQAAQLANTVNKSGLTGAALEKQIASKIKSNAPVNKIKARLDPKYLVGGLFLEPENGKSDDITNRSFRADSIDKKVYSKLVTQLGGEFDSISFDIYKNFVNPQYAHGIRDSVNNNIGQIIAGVSGEKFDQRSLTEGARKSIEGILFESIIANKTQDFSVTGRETFDFYPIAKASKYAELFGESEALGRMIAADAKRTDSEKSISDIRDKFKSSINQGLFLDKIKKFNTGGEVDSVPAMLTPGEFVINKRAAARLGKDTLNKLNNADKVQKFATGGPVGNVGASPEKIFLVLSIVSQFVSQLSTTNKQLAELTSVISSMAIQFTVLKGLTSNITDNLAKNRRSRARVLFEQAGNEFQSGSEIIAGASSNREIRRGQAIIAQSRETRRRAGQSFAQSKFFERNAGLLNITSGIGAIGAVGGDLLRTSQLNKIRSGNGGSSTLSALGGAASGAGQGAAIGAILGPWGAAIGAAAGGLYGFATSLKEAEDALRKVEFDKKFDDLTRRLDIVGAGRGTALSQAGSISAGIAEINRRRSASKSEEDVQTFKGQVSDTVTRIETFLGKLSEVSTSIEQFSKTGREAIRFLAEETKQSVDEVVATYKKDIDARNKARQVDIDLLNQRIRETQEIQKISALSEAFDVASQRVNSFTDSIIDAAKGQIGGVSLNRNPFGTLDTGGVSAASGNIASILGSGAETLAQQVTEITELQKRLPAILLEIRNRGAFEDDAFIGKLDEGLGNINAELRRSILAQAQARLIGSEGKDANAINALFADILGAAKELTAVFDPIKQEFQRAQEILNEEFSNYSKQLESLRGLREQELGIRNKIIDIAEQQAEFNSRLPGGRGRLSLEQSLGFDRERFRTITSGLPQGNLASILSGANSRFVDINRQIQGGNVSPELIEERDRQATIIERTTKALEFLADASSRAAPYIKELEQLKQLRDFRFELGKTLTFGGQSEILGASRGATGALALGKTRDITSIPRSLAGDTLSFLQGLGDTKLGILGGSSGQDVIRDTIANNLKRLGLSDDEAKAVANKQTTSKEQIIADKINNIFEDAKQANEILVNNTTSAMQKFAEEIKNSINSFIDNLRNIFKENLLSGLNIQKGNLEARAASVNSGLASANRVAGILGQNLDASSLKNIQTLLPQIQSRNQTADQLSSVRFARSRNTVGQILSRFDNGTGSINRARFEINRGLISDELIKSVGPDIAKSIIDSFDKAFTDDEFQDIANAGPFGTSLVGIANKELDSQSRKLESNLKATEKAILDSIGSEQLRDRIVSNFTAIQKAMEGLAGVNIDNLTTDANKIRAEQGIVDAQIKGVLNRNSGGTVPGSGNSDSVPAMLTPGEFVLRKSAVQAIGLQNLYAMNAQGFADGGFVGESARERMQRLFLDRTQSKSDVTNVPMSAAKYGDFELDLANDFSPTSLFTRKKFAKGGHVQKLIARRQAYINKLISRREARKQHRLDILKKREENRRFRIANFKSARTSVYDGSTGNFTPGLLTGDTADNLRAIKQANPRLGYPGAGYTSPFRKRIPAGRINLATDSRLKAAKQRLAARKAAGFNNGGAVGGNGGATMSMEALSQFNQAVTQFVSSANTLATSLNNMPREITMTANHKVEVVVLGAEAFAQMTPEIERLVLSKTKEQLNNFIREKMPDAGEIQ